MRPSVSPVETQLPDHQSAGEPNAQRHRSDACGEGACILKDRVASSFSISCRDVRRDQYMITRVGSLQHIYDLPTTTWTGLLNT